ncbi:MAG: DUF3515 family protein [Mycobacteriales bacterium]
MPVPSAVPPEVQAACTALSAALPVEVDPGVRRRPVVGDQRLTAAWGDPPVTLECGVPDPDGSEESVVVNGVTWSVREIGAGHRWTTSARTVNVAVQIPDSYPNGAEIVLPLVEPIQAALPPMPSPTPSPSTGAAPTPSTPSPAG